MRKDAFDARKFPLDQRNFLWKGKKSKKLKALFNRLFFFRQFNINVDNIITSAYAVNIIIYMPSEQHRTINLIAKPQIGSDATNQWHQAAVIRALNPLSFLSRLASLQLCLNSAYWKQTVLLPPPITTPRLKKKHSKTHLFTFLHFHTHTHRHSTLLTEHSFLHTVPISSSAKSLNWLPLNRHMQNRIHAYIVRQFREFVNSNKPPLERLPQQAALAYLWSLIEWRCRGEPL